MFLLCSGYSVVVGQRDRDSLVFSGAPRANHRGQVTLYRKMSQKWKNISNIFGEQVRNSLNMFTLITFTLNLLLRNCSWTIHCTSEQEMHSSERACGLFIPHCQSIKQKEHKLKVRSDISYCRILNNTVTGSELNIL